MADSDSQSSVFPRNVVIAGEPGVGKSSFINLVTGTASASAVNDIRNATTYTEPHPWETDTHSHAFRLWDTPGLGDGPSGTVSPRAAQHALRSLLRELAKEDGVHLLVLCMRGIARITKGMKETYQIVLHIRDQVSPNTPIVAVITESEKRCDEGNVVASMDTWWTKNENGLTACNMRFCGHACLTTLPDDCYPPMEGRQAESQRLARNLLIDHALPYSAFSGSARMTGTPSSLSLKLTRNIVVVGETGVGKSSIINLVVGSNSAVTASDANTVTVATSYHDWNLLPSQTFRFWDTPGVSKGPSGAPSHKYALNAIQSLFTELDRGGGVHLLLLCFRGGPRVTRSMKEAYNAILALRDKVSRDIPLVAVFTGLEHKSEIRDGDILAAMEQWWQDKAGDLSENHMTFAEHACITTVADHEDPPVTGRRNECQRRVRNLIIDHALTPRSVPAQDLHVVLFGETGVGKSSLVNLLAGWPVAKVSPDSLVCTLSSTEYQFQLGATTVRVWDTIGLLEPVGNGVNGYTGAIENAAKLIWRLSALGGVSLFLFCVRGSRATTRMQSNYQLFYEVLGKRQVPIALAVTHLEREPVMEEWWERNARALADNNIQVNGHACITTLDGHPKYAESRLAVQELLWRYADQRKFALPTEMWLGRLLSGLSDLLGYGLPKGKDLIHFLMRRCHLEQDVAQRVANCIEGATDMFSDEGDVFPRS